MAWEGERAACVVKPLLAHQQNTTGALKHQADEGLLNEKRCGLQGKIVLLATYRCTAGSTTSPIDSSRDTLKAGRQRAYRQTLQEGPGAARQPFQPPHPKV